LWFTPLREALDAFVASTQTEMTGSVTLSLYKGNVSVVSRQSDHSLYRTDLSSFTMGDSYDQKDAEGFIRILGLPSRTRAHACWRLHDEDVVGPVPAGAGPQFERWQRSFDFDRRLLSYELAASAAHARALKKRRSSLRRRTHQHSGRTAADWRDGCHFQWPGWKTTKPRTCITLSRSNWWRRIGEVGYKLHSGRSRNEQIATDLRLYVRAAIDELRTELADVCGAFTDRAEQAGNAAMPAYTHLQHAEPVLVAHWLLAYVEMFLRDADRLADCRKRLNVCPLGIGSRGRRDTAD
jgi:hypothetical protein